MFIMDLMTGATSSATFDCGGSGAGVSSVVECLPVVQGGIVRNSSKVRTRVLQHFQPNMYVESVRSLLTAYLVREPGHLSVLRGKLEAQGDGHNPLQNSKMFCHSPDAYT